MLKITDFFATWCRPCTQVAKVLDELKQEFPNLEIEKVDIEKQKERFLQYKVKSIPFIIIEKNGEIVDQFIGMQSKRIFKDSILKHYE